MSVLSAAVQLETKITLDALAALMQASIGRVIEVLAEAYVRALPDAEARVVRDLKQAALARFCTENPSPTTNQLAPVVTYRFSRLCFKRDVIEALGPNDAFRVETPFGSFQMTKREFQRVFPNVIKSRSYTDVGIYHYRVLPSQAEQFRLV